MGGSQQKKTKKAFAPDGGGAATPDAACPVPAPPVPPAVRMRRHARLLAFTVSLLTLLAHASSLRNGFVEWDDNLYVYDNPNIRSFDATFLKWAFTSFSASNWHPLTWVSHAADYAVWGLNPLGHHLTSVMLHAVTTFAVVIVVKRLIEAGQGTVTAGGGPASSNERAMLAAAGATGLLFGIHPVHVESVAWVAERKDLLCALFFLLSIGSYTSYAAAGNAAIAGGKPAARFFSRYYLAALGFFVLALLSKPMAVSLPGVLLILDFCPFRRISSARTFLTALWEKLPFIALSLASSILTMLAQKEGGAIQSLETVSIPSRLLVAASSLVSYLGKMIFPVDLIPFYPYPHDASPFSLKYLAAILFLVLITAACVATARRRPLLLSCWSYYVLTLLPVIGVVRVGSQSMADRYTYLPSIAPFLLIGLSVAWLFGLASGPGQNARIARIAGSGLVVLAISSMMYLTIRQISIWNNSLNLWNYIIAKEPGVDFSYNNRGWVFLDMGRYNEALDDFNRAVSLNPRYFQAYSNRGILLVNTGRYKEAIEDFDRAIYLNRSCYEAYAARGVSYRHIGQLDKAIESLDQAIAVYPNRATAYNDRGLTYAFARQYQQAMQDYNRAIELYPDFAKAYVNRGDLFNAVGEKERAVQDYRKACDSGDTNGCNAFRSMTSR